MANDEQRTTAESARIWATIESIVLSLERFNEKLSDDRKIKLFTMSRADLTKLASDVEGTKARMKAVSLIVAAISASEQQKRDEKTRLESLNDDEK